MEQKISWEARSSSANPSFMEPECHLLCWQKLATGPILSQLNEVHIFKPHLFKVTLMSSPGLHSSPFLLSSSEYDKVPGRLQTIMY